MLQFNNYRPNQRFIDMLNALNSDFDKVKNASVNITSVLPTPSASNRGQIIYLEKNSGVADEIYICRKNANDSYQWLKIG